MCPVSDVLHPFVHMGYRGERKKERERKRERESIDEVKARAPRRRRNGASRGMPRKAGEFMLLQSQEQRFTGDREVTIVGVTLHRVCDNIMHARAGLSAPAAPFICISLWAGANVLPPARPVILHLSVLL